MKTFFESTSLWKKGDELLLILDFTLDNNYRSITAYLLLRVNLDKRKKKKCMWAEILMDQVH